MDVERQAGVAVLRVSGNVIREEVGALRQALRACVTQRSNVVVDLHEVEYLSSVALRAIDDQLADLRRQGLDLRLSRVSTHVRCLLDVTGLASKIQVCDAIDDAIATFGAGVGAIERALLDQ